MPKQQTTIVFFNRITTILCVLGPRVSPRDERNLFGTIINIIIIIICIVITNNNNNNNNITSSVESPRTSRGGKKSRQRKKRLSTRTHDVVV